MAESPQNYTPAQILALGMRAEGEGSTEYAAQVYGYLIEHMGASPEAAEAQRLLHRLQGASAAAAVPPPGSQTPNTGPPSAGPYGSAPSSRPSGPYEAAQRGPGEAGWPGAGQGAGGMGPAGMGAGGMGGRNEPSLSMPPQSRSGPQPASGTYGAGPSAPPPQGPAAISAPQGDLRGPADRLAMRTRVPPKSQPVAPVGPSHALEEEAENVPLPRLTRHRDDEEEALADFRPGYTLGRYLALLLALLGWLFMVIGIVAAGLGLSGMVRSFAESGILGLPLGIEIGGAGLAVGLLLVFLAQIARAVFETANGVRELLAIEREKAGW